MAGIEFIRHLLQHANAQGSRSTTLSPLGWLAAILVTGIIGAFSFNAPTWALVCFFVALGLCVILYLLAYIYFAFKNPDALRSERFSLSKMAIEKSLKGDDLTGFLDKEPPALSGPSEDVDLRSD